MSDQGKQFCARISKDLFKQLRTAHLKMTAWYPQSNSQAKVANNIKYSC